MIVTTLISSQINSTLRRTNITEKNIEFSISQNSRVMGLWGSEKMRWRIQTRKKSDFFIDFMEKEGD